MTDELEAKMIESFAADIVTHLVEAVVIAQVADGFGKQGMTERAFRALMELEPVMHEASDLLRASFIVRRRDRERTTRSVE